MLAHSLFLLGCGTLAAAAAASKSQFVGMNIAGFEFGCLIDGTCPLDTVVSPNDVGPVQMKHFVEDDNMNIFRLPVSWQYLLDNELGGNLSATNFDTFDTLVQACLKTGAYCVLDVHNFARWNGKIIGQGGPTNAQFTSLWTQLATFYKGEAKMIFGIMNEPWELDVPLWAGTVQETVTAIRKAGASKQMILLPGTNFASAGKLVSSGSADALLGITNPDKTTDGLILDMHKYLDIDNSGTYPDCVTDNIADAFAIVAPYLRKNKRQALLSETGAGNKAATCVTDFCAQNEYLNANADVILGYISWGAGVFDNDAYILGLVPTEDADGKFTDHPLLTKCIMGPWLAAGPAVTVTPPGATKTTSSTSKSSATSKTASSGASDATDATTTKKSSTPSTVTLGATSPAAATGTNAAAAGFDMGSYKWALPAAGLVALVI